MSSLEAPGVRFFTSGGTGRTGALSNRCGCRCGRAPNPGLFPLPERLPLAAGAWTAWTSSRGQWTGTSTTPGGTEAGPMTEGHAGRPREGNMVLARPGFQETYGVHRRGEDTMRDSNCGVACAPKPPTRTVSGGSLVIFLLALFGLSANALRAQEFSEFPVPTADSQLRGITAGPDGNIWFSEQLGKKIGRITPSGVITEFPITGSLVSPEEMPAGPDGNVWFSDFISVGRVTPSGTITRFPIASNSFPGGIVTGPDGNIWFTLFATDHQRIGRISPAGGVVTEFPVFGTIQLKGLTTGPDGNLWFTDPLSNQVGRMTTSGAVTLFPLPAGVTGPYEIVTGPDGNLWFTSAFHIGRMTTAGVVTAFADPGGDFPTGIAAGPDGNMWFTEQTANHIVRITLTGQMTEFTPPTVTSGPLDIAAGSDGALWFIETRGNKIGRITVGTCAPSPTKLCLSGARFSVSATWQSATGSGVANAISLTSDTGYFWF